MAIVSLVFKSIAIAIFLLVFLTALLTNKKETKKSSMITLIVLGVFVWVL